MSNSISHAEDSAHAGPIKNPKQFVYTVFASFVLPIFIIIGLVLLVTYKYKPSGLNTASSMALNGVTEQSAERSMATRLQKVGMVEIRDANRPLKAGEEVFKAQCSACHAAGVAGAPKFGDAAAWAPRITHGYEVLLTSALKGKGAMGPQGGGDFEDVEIGRAVVYMTNAAGGNLPVPQKAGAAEAPTAGAAGMAAGAPAVQAAAPATPVSAVLAAAAPTGPTQAASTPAGLTAVAAATATALVANAPAASSASAQMNTAATTPPATALAATTQTAATTPATPTSATAPAAAAAVAAVAPVPVVAAADSAAGAALYKSVCFACHAAGVAGAPKFGDKAAWAPHIAEGIPYMVAAVKNGKGAMPPRGGSKASDADLQAAVEYMVSAAK